MVSQLFYDYLIYNLSFTKGEIVFLRDIIVEEVIQDAKNNSSSIFLKFQQLYPDFCLQLLGGYP